MKQGLQLKLGTQVTMTPQLQQAVRLLALCALDLELEVQQALESNSMLEYQDEENAEQEEPSLDCAETPPSEENIPEDLPVDFSWDDVYSSERSGQTMEPQSIEAWHAPDWDLQDYLLWQLNLTPFTDTDRLIAHAIIDAIDEDGYLGTTLEEIQQSLTELPLVELDEIEAVLHRIQQFDPIAVGARDLQECLSIQLNQLSPILPYLAEAKQLVKQYLHLLGQKNYLQIKTKLKIQDDGLQGILSLLQSLNPKPGQQVATQANEYITPDVVTMKKNGKWIVKLNKDYLTRLRINPGYRALVKRADTSRDNQFLQTQLTEAKWFLKSLQHRNETLLKVAEYIVNAQHDFFDHGPTTMKPLTLQDVANALSLHESTVSRITTQKFIYTPRGIFELKYFFSSHLQCQNGGVTSSTAIKALIKGWIDKESARKPLSDSQLVQLLDQEGIVVARRTIAKYRDAMAIPPSHQRKEFC